MREQTFHSPSSMLRTQTFPFTRRSLTWKLVFTLLVLLTSIWALIPAVRGVTLVANLPRRQPQASSTGFPVQNVQFTSTDGIKLSG